MLRPRITRPLTCAVLFGLLAPAGLRAEEPRITVGPAGMTFPEIARRLSGRGRRVQCVSSLKDCAAFVYLKDQSWDRARELVSAGLEVEIEPDTDVDPHDKSARERHWILRRDPAALNRERRFLAAYVDCLLRMMQSKAQQTLEGFSLNQNPDFVASRQQRDDLNRENMAILLNENRTAADLQRRDSLMESMMKLKAADPGNWVLAHLLMMDLNPAALRNVVVGGISMASIPESSFPPEVLAGLYWEGRDVPADRSWREIVRETRLPADFGIWGGLIFDPVRLLLQMKAGFSADGTAHGLRRNLWAGTYYTPEAIFKPSGREDIVWAGLGEAANRWLDKERQATRAFLGSSEAQKPFTIKTTRPVSSVSQVVEQWSRALDAQVVMELLPTRELLYQIGSDYGQKDGVQKPEAGANCQLSTLVSDRDAWSYEKNGGVLLVKDSFAFVDRLRHFPMGAFLTLERSLDLNASPSVHDMLAYASSVARGESAQWDWVATYRGISNSTLTRLPPLLHLLGRLPRKEFEDELTALMQTTRHPADADPPQNSPDAPKRLRLRRLAASDWENLLSEYRAFQRDIPNWAWGPAALSNLQQCEVACYVAPGGDENGTGENLFLALEYPGPGADWAATLKSFTASAWGIPPAKH